MPPALESRRVDSDASDWSSDEDDVPLAELARRLRPSDDSGLFDPLPMLAPVPPPCAPHMASVDGEGSALTGIAYVERAERYRDRAHKIWDYEKQRFLSSELLTATQKRDLQKYHMIFDRGSSRRGVCHYPSRRNHYQPYVGLSALMVDRGCPAIAVRETIVHELSHACMPGAKHSEAWKVFNRKMGGDGERCDRDKETATIIGHKIEITCSVGGKPHVFIKRQVMPSSNFLRRASCKVCHRNGVAHKLIVRRVGRGAI